MGTLHYLPAAALAGRLQELAARSPAEVLALAATLAVPAGQETEQFDRRQPEHVILAGTAGLGVFDAGHIEHRVVRLRG